MERLTNSFRLADRNLSVSIEQLKKEISRLISLNDHRSGPVKLVFRAGSHPKILLYLMEPHLPKSEEYITGVKAILLKAVRQNPTAKIWNRELRNKSIDLLSQSAAYESILVNEEGFITEASRSNVFFIREGKIQTSPPEYILPGITRMKVIELCRQSNIPVILQQVHSEELSKFEACILTGTARKIVPVRKIEDYSFNPYNPLVAMIRDGFENLVRSYIKYIKDSV